MRTVTPVYQTCSSTQDLNVTFDSVAYWALMVLICSSISCRKQKLHVMPDFTPTPWMLEKHADKGNEPWEIYAWCVNDAIAKYGGISKMEERLTTKDRIAIEDLM